jgi:CHAT domain-containing protein/tetratricopeptide (TPR) repeat protein
MRLTLITLFTCLFMSCFAQDWQSVYKEAVEAYKNEKFDEAMEKASQAIQLLKDADQKGKAYAIQIFTASCLETSQSDKGLSLIDEEIGYFKDFEPNGKNHVEAINKKAGLLALSGKYLDAASVYQGLSELIFTSTGKKEYAYYKALNDKADALLQANHYAEAQAIYSISVPALKNIPDAGEDYLYGLFNYGYALYAAKNHKQAGEVLASFIAIAEANSLQSLSEYAEAKKIVSSINSSSNVGGFMTGEDKARVALQSALANQSKDVKQTLADYAACEEATVANALLNNTSFSCFLNFARFLYSIKDYPNARLKLAQAMLQADKLYGATGAERSHLQVLQADLELQSGNKEKATELYRMALTNLAQEKSDVRSRQTHWITEQLLGSQLYDDALAAVTNFINTMAFSSLSPGDKIVFYKLQANGYAAKRNEEPFIVFLKQKLQSEPDPDLKQTFLLLLARAEKERGRLQESKADLDQAVNIKSSGIQMAELYFELARLSQQLGQFKEAELTYHKAIETLANCSSAATLTPVLYNSFATFYIELGNYAAAEKLFLRLLNEKNGNASFYNDVRQNLAAMYEQTAQYSEAKRLLIETLRSDGNLVGTQHPDYGIALQNLAALYQKTGVLDSAVLLYEQALHIDKIYYGEESLAYATKLGNLGSVYQELGNFKNARTMLEHSLAIRKKLLGADHPDYAYNLYNLAFLLYRTGQHETALPYFREVSQFYLKQISEVFPVLSDYERTAFYNKLVKIIEGYETFMVENSSLNESLPGELLNFRLQTKALLLSSSMKVRNQILNSGNSELIHKFAVWQQTKEQLASLFSLSYAERQANLELINTLTEKANELEKWLSVTSEGFASSYQATSPNWRKVQLSLKPGEAALELVRVKLPEKDSIIYAGLLIKWNDKIPSMVLMSNGKYLEGRAYRRYLNGMKFQFEDVNSYENYWKPFEPLLADVRILYISPDGIYNKVNAVTLFDPAKNQYVLDKLQVRLVTNLKDLIRDKTPPHSLTKSAALIGFPDYRLSADTRVNAIEGGTRSGNLFYQVLEGGVADLPGTGIEVSQIQKTLEANQWNVSIRMRQNAREEDVKALRQPDILHIATHGFFITPQNEESAHVFNNDLSNVQNNSMLRSGLLLAGAEKYLLEKLRGQPKSAVDDGVLTAYEVINLNLDQTQLVVLSACETGSGDVRNGEGVYGLQRAFMLAGAKTLVMSLWKVDDTATQELMTEFYSRWVTINDHADAFYNTQLEIKKKFGHPFYWGAFVVVGKF